MNERRTDFELLREFTRHGNQEAFATAVRRHLDLVYATAFRKIENEGAAEEVAQNVFAVLARKAWQFAPDDSLPAWLYRATLLEAREWLRGELRRRRREQTAAELGFNWNSNGNYLVVSKDTLRNFRLTGIKGVKLADVVCDVLAVTPEERSTVEALTQQIDADYGTWAGSHAQREEPNGDVVAKYTLPINPAFSQTLRNAFTSGIVAALGSERGELLESYATSSSWMTDHGMFNTEPATMTVKHSKAGDEPRLNLELRQGGSSMSTYVSPWQFPEAFRPIFPGGWPDVARREGFELPKEFQK
jgi:DNA-directed RNA polymerase specialized sigma24 family protein